MNLLPDEANVDARWPLRLLVRCGVGLLASWLLWRAQGPFGLVASVVIWACLLAKPAIELVLFLHYLIRARILGVWSGRYLEYHGQHLRAYLVRRQLWLVDRDVLAVLGRKPTADLQERFDVLAYDRIEGTRFYGFSEDGLQQLLMQEETPEARQFWRWLEREVFRPARRARELERTPPADPG